MNPWGAELAIHESSNPSPIMSEAELAIRESSNPSPIMSEADSTALMTPAATIHESPRTTSSAGPYAGGKYFMILRGTNRVLTPLKGELILSDGHHPDGADRWMCFEHPTGGQQGFINIASGTFIGHDGSNDVLVARANHLKQCEFMSARALPNGGHKLMLDFEGGYKDVGIDQDGRLVRTGGQPTIWEFLHVPVRGE